YTKRALARLQKALDLKPAQAVRDQLTDSISRGTLLEQFIDRALLMAAERNDLASHESLAKMQHWLTNRTTRRLEMLLAVEDRRARESEVYLCRRCGVSWSAATYATHNCRSAEQASGSTRASDEGQD